MTFKSSTKSVVITGLIIAGVGIGISLSTPLKEVPEKLSPAAKSATEAMKLLPTPAVPMIPTARTKVAHVEAQEEIQAKKVWENFKYGQELDKYATIEKKALLLEHDKVAKKKLLQDPEFIHSLQPLLTTVALQDEAIHLQNAAVDFLFEALKSDSRAEAVQVLQAVVADPSVEDESRDLLARKSLAGVKAEILFNWSSIEPTSAPEISAALPGPVSQKIWANVKKQQENNLAESAAFLSQE